MTKIITRDPNGCEQDITFLDHGVELCDLLEMKRADGLDHEDLLCAIVEHCEPTVYPLLVEDVAIDGDCVMLFILDPATEARRGERFMAALSYVRAAGTYGLSAEETVEDLVDQGLMDREEAGQIVAAMSPRGKV